MFGNLGSRNLFEVRELNYFTGGAKGTQGGVSPASAHKKAMSGGHGSSWNNPAGIFGSDRTGGRVSQTTKERKLTWSPERKAEEKKKADAHFAVNVSANQQRLSDTYGITTYDQSGNISTTPQTPESSWKTHNVKGTEIVVTNKIVGSPTLRETVEAQNKATEEFKAKWHGIKDNGVVVSEPTATRTDAVQALLTSNNQHFGTDTRNLETYLTERDYDISSIIAGETTVPDDIFKPVKQTEYRNISKQITEKLDKISNYEEAKGKNSAQRHITYGGVKGHEYFTLKEEVKILQGALDKEAGSITQETLKQNDQDTIREIVDKTTTTPQNVSRSERGVPEEEKTITQVRSFNLLPIIFIAVVGLIGIYLIRRKK